MALPASIAGLPGNNAIVWVDPPLSPSGARPGSATPTRLPLSPLTSPPEPPVPIRLLWLVAVFTVPAMLSAGAPVPVPLVLSATIVLSRTAVPPL